MTKNYLVQFFEELKLEAPFYLKENVHAESINLEAVFEYKLVACDVFDNIEILNQCVCTFFTNYNSTISQS